MLTRYKTFLIGLLLFVVFFVYYYQTSELLPLGAGPDYAAHNDAVAFLQKYSRLAVVPDDEDKLSYTVYGSTRALRPPLSYIVSAAFAKLLLPANKKPELVYRKGSALLCALTVAITFFGLALLFEYHGIAITGALLIGLLPQFAFIASYNNDDSSGLFAATLMFMILALIYKRGLDLKTVMLFGLGSGLLILSKPTAWLLAPTILLFLLFFARIKKGRILIYTSTALITTILAGGWWLLFNVNHYGIDDPFARKISSIHGKKHRRIALTDIAKGYKDLNVGYRDIVIDNYDNFWNRTYKSTIGKLDWLRLNLGSFQYTFYLAIFFIAIGYYLARLAGFAIAVASRRSFGHDQYDFRRFALESLFFFAIIFQIAMYVWRNVNTEIQLQGKYILPVFFPILVLSLSALQATLTGIARGLQNRGIRAISLPTGKLDRTGVLLLSATVIYLHVDALTNYVIPYYRPPVYNFRVSRFNELRLNESQVIARNDIGSLRIADGGVHLRSTGDDPWLALDPKLCRHFVGNVILRIGVQAEHSDRFQVFIDHGGGFSEQDSYRAYYKQGQSEIHIGIGSKQCRGLRLDPGTRPGAIDITNIAYATLRLGSRR